MQKQSRVFFQISGAGHEALGLALARHLRPGYDWFFPYYRDQALVLGLGVTPTEILLQAVGLGRGPGQRRPPDAVPLGQHGASTSSPSRARPAASASPPSAAPRPAATSCAGPQLGLPAPRRRAHLRQPRRGRVQRGRVLGEPQHARAPCTCRCCSWCPTTASPSRCPTTDQQPAPVAELVAGFRGLDVHRLDGTDYFAVRAPARRRSSSASVPGSGPALLHADVVRPYSHSAADTQTKYRSAEELADEAAPRSDRPDGARRWSSAAC